MHVLKCMYVLRMHVLCMYVFIYVLCIYACMYICIHVYICTIHNITSFRSSERTRPLFDVGTDRSMLFGEIMFLLRAIGNTPMHYVGKMPNSLNMAEGGTVRVVTTGL